LAVTFIFITAKLQKIIRITTVEWPLLQPKLAQSQLLAAGLLHPLSLGLFLSK
jgi:hypothetical protein